MQVGRWEGDVLRSFWRRWYYPANCTLYVVGDLDRSIPEIEALVKSTYDRILPGREVIDVPSSNGAQLHGATEVPAPAQSIQLGPLKPRQLVSITLGTLHSRINARSLEGLTSVCFAMI